MNEALTPQRRPLPLVFLATIVAPLLVVLGIWLISLSHQRYDVDCLITEQAENGLSPDRAETVCETAWPMQLVGGSALVVVGLVGLTVKGRRP